MEKEKHKLRLIIFEEWFNNEQNMDLRLPLASTLSFRDKLTIKEWQEFISYVYKKCIEMRNIN